MFITEFTGTWKTDLFGSHQVNFEIDKFEDTNGRFYIFTDLLRGGFFVDTIELVKAKDKTVKYRITGSTIAQINSESASLIYYRNSNGTSLRAPRLQCMGATFLADSNIDDILRSDFDTLKNKGVLEESGLAYFYRPKKYYIMPIFGGELSEITTAGSYSKTYNSVQPYSVLVRDFQNTLVQLEGDNIEGVFAFKKYYESSEGTYFNTLMYLTKGFINTNGEQVSPNNPITINNFKIKRQVLDYKTFYNGIIPFVEISENIPANYPIVVKVNDKYYALLTMTKYDVYTDTIVEWRYFASGKVKFVKIPATLYVLNLLNHRLINSSKKLYYHSIVPNTSVETKENLIILYSNGMGGYYWGVGSTFSTPMINLYSIRSESLPSGRGYLLFDEFNYPIQTYVDGSGNKHVRFFTSKSNVTQSNTRILFDDGTCNNPMSISQVGLNLYDCILYSYNDLAKVVGVVTNNYASGTFSSIALSNQEQNQSVYAGIFDVQNLPSEYKKFPSQIIFYFRPLEDGINVSFIASVPSNNPQGNVLFLNLASIQDRLYKIHEDFKTTNGVTEVIEFETNTFVYAGDFVDIGNQVFRVTEAEYVLDKGKVIKAHYKAERIKNAYNSIVFPTQLNYEIYGWYIDEKTGEWVKLSNAQVYRL